MATSPDDKKEGEKPINEAERLKTLGEALFGGGLISGVVAIASAIFAGISQNAATKATGELEKAKLLLEEQHRERNDQFIIWDRVEKQLGTDSPFGVIISSSYVMLIQDPIKRQTLCETIASVAQARLELGVDDQKRGYESAIQKIGRTMRTCSIDAREQALLAPTTVTSPDNALLSPAIEAARVAEQAAPVDEIVNAASVNPQGWDIDVFWCETEEKESEQLANKVAKLLAADADRRTTIGGETVGRIRLRKLTSEARERLAPPEDVPVVVGSSDEQPFARAVVSRINSGASPNEFFKYSRTGANSRWYVSVFACGTQG